jgi:hypothetical protein
MIDFNFFWSIVDFHPLFSEIIDFTLLRSIVGFHPFFLLSLHNIFLFDKIYRWISVTFLLSLNLRFELPKIHRLFHSFFLLFLNDPFLLPRFIVGFDQYFFVSLKWLISASSDLLFSFFHFSFFPETIYFSLKRFIVRLHSLFSSSLKR